MRQPFGRMLVTVRVPLAASTPWTGVGSLSFTHTSFHLLATELAEPISLHGAMHGEADADK